MNKISCTEAQIINFHNTRDRKMMLMMMITTMKTIIMVVMMIDSRRKFTSTELVSRMTANSLTDEY